MSKKRSEQVATKWEEDMHANGLKVTHNDVQSFKTGYEFGSEDEKDRLIKKIKGYINKNKSCATSGEKYAPCEAVIVFDLPKFIKFIDAIK